MDSNPTPTSKSPKDQENFPITQSSLTFLETPPTFHKPSLNSLDILNLESEPQTMASSSDLLSIPRLSSTEKVSFQAAREQLYQQDQRSNDEIQNCFINQTTNQQVSPDIDASRSELNEVESAGFPFSQAEEDKHNEEIPIIVHNNHNGNSNVRANSQLELVNMTLNTPLLQSNDPEISITSQNNFQQNENQITRVNPPQHHQRAIRPPQPITLPPGTISETEVKLYINRAIGFCIAMGLTSLVIVEKLNGTVSRQDVFLTFYCYFVYLIIEDIIRMKNKQRELWRRKEDMYNIPWSISNILFVALMDLRLENLIPMSTVAIIPFIIVMTFSYSKTNAPEDIRETKTLLKCAYLIEVFCITARLDHLLNWEWIFLFVFFWIYIGTALGGLASFDSFGVFLTLFVAFHPRRRRENLGLKVKLTGFFWQVVYYGLGIIASLGVLGLSNADKPDGDKVNSDFKLLKVTATISFYVNIFLVLYTLLMFSSLKKYLRLHSLIMVEGEAPRVIVVDKHRIEFMAEEKESYFKMVSNTYCTIMDSKAVESYKEDLKQKFQINNDEICQEDLEKLFIGAKETVYRDNIDVRYGQSGEYRDENGMDEMEQHIISEQIYKSEKGEESLCYVCCIRPFDAVFMGCGHTGICHECAISVMTKKNQCMQCRKQVELIYRLDLMTTSCEVVRGVEVTKVIKVDLIA